MPIDPRIPLGVNGPAAQRSPIATLGALSQLRDQQEQVNQRQLMNEQRQRDLDDHYAIEATLARTGNPDTAIEQLYKSGRSTAASALSKQLYEWRDAKAKALKEQQEIASSNFKMLTQIANGITDQKSLDLARPAAKALLVPVFGEQDSDALLSQLGTEYDPERIKQVRTWGTTTSDLLAQQKEAREAAEKAIEIGRNMLKDGVDRDKARIEADKYWSQAASGFLSTAKSQEQWDAFQRMMMLGGAPQATLARFGNEYSPDAVARAKTLGMTPKEVEDVKHQGVQDRIAQGNLDARNREIDRRETDDGGGSSGRPLTANRKSEIEGERAKAFGELEKEFRERVADGDAPDDLKAEMGQRKLVIEDAYRLKMGMKPLLQT